MIANRFRLRATPALTTICCLATILAFTILANPPLSAAALPCDSSLTREAESGMLAGSMALDDDAGASGGSYVWVPPSEPNVWAIGSDSTASFCFDISVAGRYRIDTKVWGSDSRADSFYVTVDGLPNAGYKWDTGVTSSFVDAWVSDRDGADPVEVQLSAGQHTVAFILRESGARLDTVELVYVDEPECGTSLVHEAESARLTGSMQVVSDADASGGAFIQVPPAERDVWKIGSSSTASFCFDVVASGRFQIGTDVQGVTNVRGAGQAGDSFFVTVDGWPKGEGYLWDTGTSSSFVESSVSHRNRNGGEAMVVELDLAAGRHTVTFHQRESGTRLDTVALVRVGPASDNSFVYVEAGAPDGGDGTQVNPFNEIEQGMRRVQGGQTLLVGGGDYREFAKVVGTDLAEGTAIAPVRVQAAAGERPVIHGALELRNPVHWDISGINVTWDEDVVRDAIRDGEIAASEPKKHHMVKLNGGAHWTFRDAEIWGAESFAALVIDVGSNDPNDPREPIDWTLSGLYVHDTFRSNGTNQDHLLYINGGGGGGLIKGNVLVNSENGRAIKVGTVNDIRDPRIRDVHICYNTMVDNQGPSNIQLSYKVSDVLVTRNVLVDTGTRYNVSAFKLNGANNVVAENLAYDSEFGERSYTGAADPEWFLGSETNTVADPDLDGAYLPQNLDALGYGHGAVASVSPTSCD